MPNLSHSGENVPLEPEVDGEVWRFCLAVYKRPGLDEACLRLQDRAGLDVVTTLFCIWAGCAGPGRLRPEAMAAALEVSRLWGAGVTAPLRAARRVLKDGALGAAEARLALRREVVRAERRSERIALSLLERIGAGQEAGARGPDSARANLDAYLDAVGCRRDAEVERDLDALVEAGCFNGRSSQDSDIRDDGSRMPSASQPSRL